MRTRPDKMLSNPPEGQISSVKFLPRSDQEENLLAVGSWDNAVRLYDFKLNVCMEYSTEAPVLSLSPISPTSIAFGGLDKNLYVKEVDVYEETNKARNLGSHAAPICSVHYSNAYKCLVSGGWDSEIKIWDPALDNRNVRVGTINVEHKVFCMDVRGHLVAAGVEEGKVCLWDLRNLSKNLKKTSVKDSLTIQCIGIYPNLKRLVYGTWEGRASIETIEGTDSKNDFLFKPHIDKVKGISHPVNAVSFLEDSSRFLMGGSDGKVRIWDPDTRKQMADFTPYPNQIAALDSKGKYAAVGCSYMDDRELSEDTEVPEPAVFVRDIAQYIH